MFLLDHHPTDRETSSGAGNGASDVVAFVQAGRQRRGAVREMLAALEYATAAGQHHLMRKVVAVLVEEAGASEPWLTESQRRIIAAGLTALERETSRLAPDGTAFARSAAQILDTLSGVA